MSDTKFALYLGAGFSKWAANLPVANQLFDFNIEVWGLQEDRKLRVVELLKHNWDIKHPNGLSEQFIADALNFEEKNRRDVLWYIARRLSEPFIWKEFHSHKWRRHVFMIDENRRFNLPGVIKAQRLLQKFRRSSLAGIITTNYDMMVEYAIGTSGFNYGLKNETLIGRGPYPLSEWRNPVTLKGDISLAKIHGSISWDENARYTDGRRGLTGHALIVAPTREKQLPGLLASIWKLGACILENVTRLVFFGFAFNPYDDLVLDWLKSAGCNVKSVLLIDIEPKIERAHELWPDAHIEACPPPTDGDAKIRTWLIS
jgi:hypothetical protein